MSANKEHKVSCKVWLELRGEPLIGKGGAKILQTIRQVESISATAKETGMSYRYIWNYLSKLKRRLGEPVVTTFKGGNKGGGGAKLTALGIKLLNEYKQAEIDLKQSITTEKTLNKINTENRLKGTINQIQQSKTTAKLEFIIESPTKLTLIIPKKNVEELNLKPEDKIEVTLKDSNIRIIKTNQKHV